MSAPSRRRPRDAFLKDGLYRVETPTFVAGFVVADGIVTACAPILRRRLGYWMTQGKRVGGVAEQAYAAHLKGTGR